MTPDLNQNLLHTGYLLFAHNYIVFAYFFGLLLSVFLSLKHPSRFATLLIIGFALLTFSFEYDKHIIDGLRNQTIQSLITDKPHYTVQKWVDLVISDLLPILLYSGGWLNLFLALVLASNSQTGSDRPRSH